MTRAVPGAKPPCRPRPRGAAAAAAAAARAEPRLGGLRSARAFAAGAPAEVWAPEAVDLGEYGVAVGNQGQVPGPGKARSGGKRRIAPAAGGGGAGGVLSLGEVRRTWMITVATMAVGRPPSSPGWNHGFLGSLEVGGTSSPTPRAWWEVDAWGPGGPT